MDNLDSDSNEKKRAKQYMIRNTVHPQSTNDSQCLPRVLDNALKDLAKVCKLLSDETRLRVLLYLTQQGELHVRALCEMLGQSQPAVSHHLALLRMAGLIESRRDGKHNFYRIIPERFQRVLDQVFAAVPASQRAIRFEDYVLSHEPQENLE